jgi:hypothetical protein
MAEGGFFVPDNRLHQNGRLCVQSDNKLEEKDRFVFTKRHLVVFLTNKKRIKVEKRYQFAVPLHRQTIKVIFTNR